MHAGEPSPSPHDFPCLPKLVPITLLCCAFHKRRIRSKYISLTTLLHSFLRRLLRWKIFVKNKRNNQQTQRKPTKSAVTTLGSTVLNVQKYFSIFCPKLSSILSWIYKGLFFAFRCLVRYNKTLIRSSRSESNIATRRSISPNLEFSIYFLPYWAQMNPISNIIFFFL